MTSLNQNTADQMKMSGAWTSPIRQRWLTLDYDKILNSQDILIKHHQGLCSSYLHMWWTAQMTQLRDTQSCGSFDPMM
jgi:hypothetical protein